MFNLIDTAKPTPSREIAQRSSLLQGTTATHISTQLDTSDLRLDDICKSESKIVVGNDKFSPKLPKPPLVSPPGNRVSKKIANFTDSVMSMIVEDNVHNYARGAEKPAPPKQGLKMNPMIIETWLNETLKDKGDEELPEPLLKGEKRSALSAMGIDRVSLFTANVSHENVDRIYRSLFVHSLGFYEILSRSLDHADNRHFILTSLWRVFSILLQNCCKTDYQLTVAKVQQLHKAELYQVRSEFTVQLRNNECQYKELMTSYAHLQKMLNDMEDKLKDEKIKCQQLENDMKQSTKSQEEEVQLRLRFEAKLNQLHSVQRELQNAYNRAEEELKGVREQNSQMTKNQTILKVQGSKLRATKADLQTQLKYQKETVKGLVKEIEKNRRKILEHERTLNDKILQVESLKIQIKEQRQHLTQKDQLVQNEKEVTEREKSDKEHVKRMLSEAIKMKQMYQQLVEKTDTEKQEAVEKLQQKERDYIEKCEVETYQAGKIQRLETEKEELTQKYEELKDRSTKLKILLDASSSKCHQFEKDLLVSRDCQEATNKERLRLELLFHQSKERIEMMTEVAFKLEEDKLTAERSWQKFEKRYEEFYRRYQITTTEKERLTEEVKNLKGEIMKKEETMKIALEMQSKARSEWAAKYDMLNFEAKADRRELYDNHKVMKDNEIKISEQAQKIKAQKELIEGLQQHRDGVSVLSQSILSQRDKLHRDVIALKERIRLMNQVHSQQLENLENKTREKIKYTEYLYNQLGMEHQDFRMKLLLKNEKLAQTTKKLNEKKLALRKTEHILEDTKDELQRRKQSYNKLLVEFLGLKSDYKDVTDELQEKKEEISKLEGEFKEIKEQLDVKESEILNLLTEVGETKKELTEKKELLVYYEGRQFASKETDTFEFDALFSSRQLSRLQRAAASTPSSQASRSHKRFKDVNIQTNMDIPASPQSLFSRSEQAQSKKQFHSAEFRGRSHPSLFSTQLPILLGSPTNLNSESSKILAIDGNNPNSPHRQFSPPIEYDRGSSHSPPHLDLISDEEQIDVSHVQSSRRPIQGAQKLGQLRSRTTVRQVLNDLKDRQSIYSSHKSLEGNEVLRSVYTTSQLQGRQGIFTPTNARINNDKSFPDIKRQRSKFVKHKVQPKKVQIRSSSHISPQTQPLNSSLIREVTPIPIAENQDLVEANQQPLLNEYAFVTKTTDSSPEPQKLQEIRVNVSHSGSQVGSRPRGVVASIQSNLMASFQSQESLEIARRALGSPGSGKIGGFSSLTSYRLTRGDDTRSGSTVAGTAMMATTNVSFQTGSGPLVRIERPSINQSVKSGIKRMIRAAATRPDAGNQ